MVNKLEIEKMLQEFLPGLPETTIAQITAQADFFTSQKGTKLIVERKRHYYFYLNLKGGVKSYYLRDSREVCSWFAFEGEWISTIKSFEGLGSNETIELLEDAEFIRFNIHSIKQMAEEYIDLSHWLMRLITEHAVFLEEKLYQLQFMTSQERYKAVLEANPGILQRVSLTDIASYLGMSRETLSRVRAQK